MTAAAPVPGIPGYRDLSLHRQSSSADVYRAVSERLNLTVAIKLLRLDDTMTPEQFQRELDIALRLSTRPHLIRILDSGIVDERPYLAMEFCPDGAYTEIVSRYGPVSIADAVDVGIKIAEALQAVHELGLIHRDVTPGNVLRSRHGPALADFGIARKPADLTGTVTLHKLTPHHAAPEALLRQQQSVTSDVYSLGSTLWFLLAGYPPYAQQGEQNPDPFAYRERALRRPTPLVPRPDVPVWLRTEIARAMNKRPSDRHLSASAFGRALRRNWESWRGEPWRPPVDYPPLDSTPEDSPLLASVADPPPDLATGADPPSTRSSKFSVAGAAENFQDLEPPPPDHVPWMPPAPDSPATMPHSPTAVSPTSSDSVSSAFTTGPVFPPEPRSPVPHPEMAPVNPADRFPAPAVTAPVLKQTRHRRQVPVAAFLAAAVVGIVLGILVVVVFRSGGEVATQPSASPEASTARINADKAPTGVTLNDRGSSVVISWTDHTGNAAPHYVVGGPRGASPRAMAQVEKGITGVTIEALNPETDYCFTVIAVISVDEVARSGQVCTNRQ